MSLSHSDGNNNTSAGDLGWQEPERKKKKKDTSTKAVDTTDNGAASARSKVAKVSIRPLPI